MSGFFERLDRWIADWWNTRRDRSETREQMLLRVGIDHMVMAYRFECDRNWWRDRAIKAVYEHRLEKTGEPPDMRKIYDELRLERGPGPEETS